MTDATRSNAPAMSSYVTRVAVGFTVGGVIAVLGLWVFETMQQSRLLTAMGYAIGGAISGASLGKGWRPALGFGVAYVFFAFWIPMLLMGAAYADSGPAGLLIVPAVWFLFYAVGGGIGALASGLEWRVVKVSAAAFGVGGSITAVSIGIAFELGAYVGPVIPHVLGGVLLAVALEYPSHKRRKLGLCLKCGYDLRGSIDRCPECGQEFAPKVDDQGSELRPSIDD